MKHSSNQTGNKHTIITQNKFKTLIKSFGQSVNRILSEPRLLYVWTLVMLLVPNFVLDITEPYSWITCIANILFAAGLYVIILSYRRRIGTAVLMCLPFMIFAAFQLVLSYLYGESIIAVDMFLNVVTTNVDEVNELLGNLIYAIATVVALYLPPLCWAIYAIVKKLRLSQYFASKARYAGVISMVMALILCTISSTGIAQSMRHSIFPINVVCNLCEAIHRTIKTNHYLQTSADFSYYAKSSRPATDREVYVMVIGETSRAINWQLGGYKRNTNPQLSELSGVVFFPKAISESNTTHKSVPMLMSAVSAENFDSIYHSKSIITAMKEAGFHTYFFSNQMPNRSFTQFFGEEADEVRYTDFAQKPHPFDAELAGWLAEALTDTVHTKQFFVLHTYGSHFLYRDRYPEEFEFFLPDDAIDANRANRESLINGYDNSIRYTDHVLSIVIHSLNSIEGRAAMLYSADHGEDIFDDHRNRFLHASPNPTYYQIHVASLAWMNDSLRSEFPTMSQNLISNSAKAVSPQKSLFHTMLELSGVTSPIYQSTQSLANSGYEYTTPVYLTDINQSVPLLQSGLKVDDIKLIEHFAKL